MFFYGSVNRELNRISQFQAHAFFNAVANFMFAVEWLTRDNIPLAQLKHEPVDISGIQNKT